MIKECISFLMIQQINHKINVLKNKADVLFHDSRC